jgi:AraC family transcriptional regulator
MAERKDYMASIVSAVESIENALETPVSVQQICEASEVSPWQFQRIFRAYVGDSIGNYIRGRRLASALQELQLDPEQRLLDLALRFQFGSHEAFTRAFKTHFGVAPTEIKKNPLRRLPMSKPRLDERKLQHIAGGIKKTPEIVTLPRMLFAGKTVSIHSPLGVDSEFDGKAVRHWREFNLTREKIAHRVPGVSYGLALAQSAKMDDEMITYLAAVEVSSLDGIAAEFTTLELPSQRYARFEVTGFQESCHVTTDYIYGIWLPESGYERAAGVDYELFDHKVYDFNNPKSISYYFLPI